MIEAAEGLVVSNLAKSFGKRQVVRDVSLSLGRGEVVGLLGPNGAGKTSLIGIVTSLVTKTSGEVSVFGHHLDSDLNAVKNAIGVVPQELNLNLWDKVGNIVVYQAGFYGLTRARARQRAEVCLRQLQLWDRRNDTARTLSGGMKRRLMIARALMHEPRLLILDEPTAGVDIEIRRSMWDFLREINVAGTSIILTTHYLEEAENLCRSIAIIDHGRVIEQGPMTGVLAKRHEEVFLLTPREPVFAVPLIPGFEIRLNGPQELEVALPRSRSVNELFAALSAAGVQILSLRNKANRLEELFLTLTERKGHSSPADRPPQSGLVTR